MRYFLKLATEQGWYEEVDEYTYKNAAYAQNDAVTGPRYSGGTVVVDGDTIRADLRGVPVRDLAILARTLQAVEPAKVEGGFIRMQPCIVFLKGKSKLMRTADGAIWKAA